MQFLRLSNSHIYQYLLFYINIFTPITYNKLCHVTLPQSYKMQTRNQVSILHNIPPWPGITQNTRQVGKKKTNTFAYVAVKAKWKVKSTHKPMVDKQPSTTPQTKK